MPHFADEANITIQGGTGGNGCVAFRREKFIPYGGPSGGNGGTGGNVIFRANPNLNTLIDYLSQKHFKAEDGLPGSGSNKQGRSGSDLTLEVPPGTILSDRQTGKMIADLSTPSSQHLVARGGRGGKGNAAFVSSVRQAPRFAEKGEEGETLSLHLELRLIADVALIGYPSVGKSTLISAISAARPRIADYDFTTLVPNLGVVRLAPNKSFVVCDIPGLIQGASQGKGLGHTFLRHIRRSRLLVHLLDPLRPGDLLQRYQIINQELQNFDPTLASLPQFIAINKIDALSPQNLSSLKKTLTNFFPTPPYFISAHSSSGLQPLLWDLYNHLASLPKPLSESPDPTPPIKVLQPHLDNPRHFEAEKISPHTFRLSGPRLEQIFNMTPLDNPEGLARVIDVLHKIGALHSLKRLGAKPGDRLLVSDKEIEYLDWENS